MKLLLLGLGFAGLGLTLIPCGARFAGAIDEAMLKHLMLAGTVLWFVAAIGRDTVRDKARPG